MRTLNFLKELLASERTVNQGQVFGKDFCCVLLGVLVVSVVGCATNRCVVAIGLENAWQVN